MSLELPTRPVGAGDETGSAAGAHPRPVAARRATLTDMTTPNRRPTGPRLSPHCGAKAGAPVLQWSEAGRFGSGPVVVGDGAAEHAPDCTYHRALGLAVPLPDQQL
jgi:hypothetical protein